MAGKAKERPGEGKGVPVCEKETRLAASRENESLEKSICGQGDTCPTHSQCGKLLKYCDTQSFVNIINQMQLCLVSGIHRLAVGGCPSFVIRPIMLRKLT